MVNGIFLGGVAKQRNISQQLGIQQQQVDNQSQQMQQEKLQQLRQASMKNIEDMTGHVKEMVANWQGTREELIAKMGPAIAAMQKQASNLGGMAGLQVPDFAQIVQTTPTAQETIQLEAQKQGAIAKAELPYKNQAAQYAAQAGAKARQDYPAPASTVINVPAGYQPVTNPDGSMGMKPVPGGPADPNNPKNIPDTQRTSAIYAHRMLQAERVLDSLGSAKNPYVPGTGTEAISDIPGIGNKMVSDKFQQFSQARDNFINAVLRRESGAAIAPSEYESANKQYFPVPGDSPKVLAQKAANRRLAIEGIKEAAGGAFNLFNAHGAEIPKEASDYLKAHPDTAAAFDAKYGPGSSDIYLKGK